MPAFNGGIAAVAAGGPGGARASSITAAAGAAGGLGGARASSRTGRKASSEPSRCTWRSSTPGWAPEPPTGLPRLPSWFRTKVAVRSSSPLEVEPRAAPRCASGWQEQGTALRPLAWAMPGLSATVSAHCVRSPPTLPPLLMPPLPVLPRLANPFLSAANLEPPSASNSAPIVPLDGTDAEGTEATLRCAGMTKASAQHCPQLSCVFCRIGVVFSLVSPLPVPAPARLDNGQLTAQPGSTTGAHSAQSQ